MNKAETAFLFLWEGVSFYTGSSIATDTHEHHAMQIIVSRDESFKMRVIDSEWKEFKSLIIDSDQPHECVLDSGRVYFLNIEPESVQAAGIRKNYLTGSKYTAIPENIVNSFISEIEQQFTLPVNCENVLKSISAFINRLSNISGKEVNIDKRVEKVIGILQSSLNKKIKLKELAGEINLSGTRLVHLFKEQTGIPIRKYILWYRINSAVKEFINGKNLTEAAHSAGFSDAAHFSRTFKRMFGISAASLLKNSQNIQAFVFSN